MNTHTSCISISYYHVYMCIHMCMCSRSYIAQGVGGAQRTLYRASRGKVIVLL